MNIQRIYRHGDVVLFKLNEEEKYEHHAAEDVATLILAFGEATGHAHRLSGSLETLHAVDEMEGILFRVRKQSVLTHEEHATMVLEPGVYFKTDQVEYDPFREAIRPIVD